MKAESASPIIDPKDCEFECSQALGTVNVNVEDQQLLETKRKKMSSNRRKREKIKQKKQQSRRALHQIIKSMCSLKSNFEQNLKTIDALLEVDLDEDRFYEFISKVTREQMDILAVEIHTLTANFCSLYKEDKAINPAQIARLFEMISIVKQASIQIERVINYFIIKGDHSDFQNYLHRDLEFSTLKYIVESDPMKVFSYGYIARKTLINFVKHSSLKQKTNIMNRFKTAQQFSQQSEQCLQCYEQLQTNTVSTQAQQSKKKKKKKKNKSKTEQQNCKMENTYKEIQVYNTVIKNLSELVIWEGDRQSCYYETDWLDQIKQRMDKNR